MTKQTQIPPAMLEAAARAILRAQGYTMVWRAETQRDAEALAQATLEAAGVARLIERIAELEAQINAKPVVPNPFEMGVTR